MALRIAPIKLTQDKIETLAAQAATQKQGGDFSRSHDEENFPVWRTPKGGKFLAYILNHRQVDEEGNITHVYDSPLIHFVDNGRNFRDALRCSKGIVAPELGLDGSCPACDLADKGFDLYNVLVDHYESMNHTIIRKVDTEDARKIRANFLDQRPVTQAERRHVMPVVIFELDNKTGINPVVGEDGKLKYRLYWFVISDNQYKNKFEKALGMATGDPVMPGKFFVLDYTYDTKGKDPNAMDAARNLTVGLSQAVPGITDSAEIVEGLEKLGENWTISKAIEMVKDSAFYPVDQVASLLAPLGTKVDAKIEQYQNDLKSFQASVQAPQVPAQAQVGAASDNSDVQAILAGAAPAPAQQAPSASEVATSYGL